MIQYIVGHCDIETTIHALEKFAHNTYYRFHKSSRLKHMVLSDKRYPNLKITDDIFSLAIWIITEDGDEERIFLDGDVFLNKIKIHTISLDGEMFSEEACKEISRVLRELTGIGEGVIFAEEQESLIRFEKGKTTTSDTLINEMYDSLSDEMKAEHNLLFKALQGNFSPNS